MTICGKYCEGCTLIQTFSDTKHLAKEKVLDTFFFQNVKEPDLSDSFVAR